MDVFHKAFIMFYVVAVFLLSVRMLTWRVRRGEKQLPGQKRVAVALYIHVYRDWNQRNKFNSAPFTNCSADEL